MYWYIVRAGFLENSVYEYLSGGYQQRFGVTSTFESPVAWIFELITNMPSCRCIVLTGKFNPNIKGLSSILSRNSQVLRALAPNDNPEHVVCLKIKLKCRIKFSKAWSLCSLRNTFYYHKNLSNDKLNSTLLIPWSIKKHLNCQSSQQS